jgi:hypothetical protein
LVWRPHLQSRLAFERHLFARLLAWRHHYFLVLAIILCTMLGFDPLKFMGNVPSLLLVVSFSRLVFLSSYILPRPLPSTNYQSLCPPRPPTCPCHYL